MALPYKKGSQGPEIGAFQDWAYRYAASYAGLIGPKDQYFGLGEEAFVKVLQGKLGIPQTGIFDSLTAGLVNYKAGGVTAPTIPKRRKIYIYTAPGSGGTWSQGPSFALGELCKDRLQLNHQPISFTMGGYLGFMGGDPKFSYVEVTYDQYKSLEYLLDNCPDINDPEWEGWFSGYSQSADGMEDALEILFGDGGFIIPATGEVCGPGKYRHLRHRINGIVSFGNPSTAVTGIARKKRPAWMEKLKHNINKPNDFYAVVPASDKIRPAFYAAIVKAEMELPFFAYVLKISIPIIEQWVKVAIPVVGPMISGFGPLTQIGLGLLPQLQGMGNNPLLGNMLSFAGDASADDPVPGQLLEILSPTGVLANIPGLIGLIGALPGLQAHGMYGPEDIGRAFDTIATFGTKWKN